MVDKMMRNAGRGEDGLAKPISVTNEGITKIQSNGGITESSLFSDESAITVVVSTYNQAVIDVKGENPYLFVQGKDFTGEWQRLPHMNVKRFLMTDPIEMEGRYYIDVMGYDELRIIKASSSSLYQGSITLLVDPLPAPLDTEIKYQRITPADDVVDGYFRAIEPLTDITMDVATRFLHGYTSGVFQNTDVRLAGQPIYGPFNRVKIRDGVALLVLL